MTKPRRPRSTALAFWVTLFIAAHCLGAPPTEGLIHWWPDPAEGTDQVTGRKGIRRGFGPTEENPEVRFGYAAGWVELGPGITNRTFTISGWVRIQIPQPAPIGHSILSQDSGLGDGWELRCGLGGNELDFVFQGLPVHYVEQAASVKIDRWKHVAVRINTREIDLWLDGALVATRSASFDRFGDPGPLCVGNSPMGESPWDGDLSDLRIYNRVLSEEEIRTLSESVPSQAKPLSLASDVLPVLSVSPQIVSNSEYRLHQFTTDNGLPSSEIQCLLQGRNGALWFGTEDGLTRYDGHRFETTDATAPEFRISGPDVGAVAEDEAGSRWLGMFHGLVRQQGTLWQSFTNIGPAHFIRRVAPASDGSVWLVGHHDTAPRGRSQLRHFDTVRNRLLVDISVPGHVLNLWPADDGVWMATDEPAALWRFHETDGSVELILHIAAITHDSDPRVFPSFPLARMRADAGSRGVRAEVCQENDSPFQWVQVRLNESGPTWTWTREKYVDWHLVEVGNGSSLSGWVPAKTGLFRRESESWKHLRFGGANLDAHVRALTPNSEGGVWAVTNGDGLWLIQPHPVRMLSPEEDWARGKIMSLQRLRDGRLLVGGRDNSLTNLILAHVNPRDYSRPSISRSLSGGGLVAEHLDGSILRTDKPGTEGVFREWGGQSWFYSFGPNRSTPKVEEVSQILGSRDGGVWVVSEKCLLSIPRLRDPPDSQRSVALDSSESLQFLNKLPENVYLCGLAEAPDGAIWVGSTGAGLFRVFEGRVENFPELEMLADNPCVPLGFSPDGTLWLGSEAGLGIWRNGQYHWVRPTDGLPESLVSDVEEGEGHVWFAGRRGVHAISRDDLEAFFAGTRNHVSAISLGRGDGLASTETQLKSQPAMAKTDDGQIWVATAHGVAHFQPRDVLSRLRPPPVAVDRFMANEQVIQMRAGLITVPPGGGRVVEINFSSLSFVAPERVTFQYRLNGPGGPTDEVGRDTAQGYAVFTHLRPGRHVFTVKARSGNGVTSYPAARLEFDIEPHFYQTTVFQLLVVVAVLLLMAGLIVLQVGVFERQAAREQERRLVAERTRIAQDMHDDLGSGLARLAWKNGAMDTSNTEDFRKQIQQMARDLLRSLDEAVWAINPTKDHLEGMVNYLGSWLQDYFTNSPLILDLDLPPSVPDRPVPAQWRHHVLMIVREICANAVKHSQATQMSVGVCLAVDPAALRIQLRDNGVGFPGDPDGAHSPEGYGQSTGKLGGNGIRNLRDRAAALRARLQIVSHPGSGTEVTLTIPLPPVA